MIAVPSMSECWIDLFGFRLGRYCLREIVATSARETATRFAACVFHSDPYRLHGVALVRAALADET